MGGGGCLPVHVRGSGESESKNVAGSLQRERTVPY